MKRVMYGAFLVLAVSFAAHAHGGQLSIVIDGRAVSTIVVPKDAGSWTNKAAQWLQEYIRKASGAEVKIISEDKAPTGTLISVGHTKMAAKAGIDDSDLRWDDCRLVVKGNVLFLIGRDDPGTETHDWVGPRGTNRAVITFLEDFCGVRWFLPSPEGEFVPAADNIRVPVNLDQITRTAFAYTDCRSVYDVNILNEPGKSLSAQANNYRKAVKVIPGGHTYYAAVPQDTYGESHPEYFALIDGKRRNSDWTKESPYGHHLCSTNPDVKKLLVEHTRKRFDLGFDWISVGQEDGYLRCQCPECEKMDNYRDFPEGSRWEDFQNTKLRDNPPERLFILHKAVIDEVAVSHPDKMVMLMCYAPTAWPSKKIEYFGDNVIGELMNVNPEYIEAWSDKVAGLTCFLYWFNTQCPMGLNIHMTAREAAVRIRYLHENGFVGLGLDCEATWGLQGPVFYMLGRLMGDPNQDYNAIVEEYCRGVYGKAAGTMLEFFRRLEERLSEVLPVAESDISANARNVGLPRWMTTTDMFLAQYPPAVLGELEALIQKAEKEADTKRTQGWVRLSRDQFDFIKLLTEMLISYRAWQANATHANWQEMKERVETFEAYREKIVTYPEEYTAVWWPGHDIFCKWLTANIDDTGIAYYTSWENRKAVVMKEGLRGRAMGYGDSYYYSFIKEPLTLDFSKPE